MYFSLHYEVPEDEDGGYFLIDDGVEVAGVDSWSMGRALLGKPSLPIEINLMAVEGFGGRPSDMYDGNICLMSACMVAALREGGVTNIETFPAILASHSTGQRYDFSAVNIVGLVSRENFVLGGSGLSIAAKTDSPLMLRLLEDTATILVHDSVRKVLLDADLPSLRFIDPRAPK